MLGRSSSKAFYAKIAHKILPYQIRIEQILTTIFLLGAILKEAFEISDLIIILPLSTLSFMYMILAYKSHEAGEKILKVILNKVLYISYSVSVVGILFTILRWPGASAMVIMGLSAMCAGTVGSLLYKDQKESKENSYNTDLIRSIIIASFYGLIQLGHHFQ